MMEKLQNDYENTVERLCRIPGFTRKHSVEETRALLHFMGDPEKTMKIVHVAGTNGKGSVCAYLAGILTGAGYRVGLFTSPHLVDIRERFQIDGEPISKETFLEAVEYVESMVTECGADYPTFFEMMFFIGMHVFSNAQVDILILETGMGGRLDATNAVSRKDLTLITKIGLDHTRYLGNTLEEIAGEKAGIILSGVPVIVEAGNDPVADVFLRKAAQNGSPCRILSGKDYGEILIHKNFIDFSFYSQYYGTVRPRLSTTALYQVDNTALVLAAVENLVERKVIDPERVTGQVLLDGLYQTRWAGRMEEAAPGFFVDGAHNVDGIQAFISSVAADQCVGRRSLIFSASADKDYPQMLKLLSDSGLFSRIILTPMHTNRGAGSTFLMEAAGHCKDAASENAVSEDGVFMEAEGGLPEVLERTVKKIPEGDRVYLAGSLYLVGEAKEYLSKRGDHDSI
ncbi:MAG: bifunctional folylpolyglutamate synthase/dihydrofolate synthase [Lachnospiraceae bacterium]|nr:bifunctional folylpolyglutamate synthase/dihydrofolate synthase [Lachnospiraceae bacterium]